MVRKEKNSGGIGDCEGYFIWHFLSLLHKQQNNKPIPSKPRPGKREMRESAPLDCHVNEIKPLPRLPNFIEGRNWPLHVLVSLKEVHGRWMGLVAADLTAEQVHGDKTYIHKRNAV